jgi:putative hydrolase of the HAD superfamily
MIKVVLFDADGVLINGEMFSLILERDYGIPTEKTTPFYTGPFQECLTGKVDLKKVIIPYLKEWGWENSVDEFLSSWFKAEHTVDEEIIEYIQGLRSNGIKCYVATNQEKYRAEYMLEQMGFKDKFDKIYASAHLGHQKPDLKFYESVLKDISRANKDEVLFWDDSPAKVDGAIKFGIHGEVYTSFADFKLKMQTYL